MSIKDEYVVILRQRLKEDGIDDAPDYYDNSPTIKAEINLLSRNLQETIDFLNNDCSAEQLIWLSEVFEEISAKLQSWDFIDALHRCADRYTEECKVYNIRECIEYAIGQLNDEVYQQRFPLKND